MTDRISSEQNACSEIEIIAELSRRLQAGQRGIVEQLLSDHQGLAGNDELIVELIYREYMILDELGESIEPQHMYERFPQWRDRLERLLQVHWAFDELEDTKQSRLHETKDDVLSATVNPANADTVTDIRSRTNQIGNYILIEEIGRGGMGVVYKAKQLGLDRLVALKIIQSGFVDPKQRQRFFQEAETAAKLQHSNIVQIHEVGDDEGTPFISMQLIDGQSLDQRLAGQVFSATDAARLVSFLAETVQYAHKKGVIHRDLKPGNVLLQTAGSGLKPVITDFGLARNVAEDQDESGRTHTMAIIGTPSYMPPEQADFAKDDPAPTNDIYGLGAILYELLTGKPPFVGTSVVDTIAKVISQPPLAPSKLSRNIPRDLETICLKCLEKPCHQRYQSAAEVGEDLQRFIDHRPILARRASWMEQAWRWTRRKPVVAGLSLALVLAIVVGASAVLWQWNSARVGWSEARKTGEDLQQQLYFNQIALANSEWSLGNTVRAEELLETCEPQRRDWEWSYLNRVFYAATHRLVGHQGNLLDVEFSPDDRWLASCGGDWNVDQKGEAFIWNALTGELVHRLAVHAAGCSGIQFSSDSSRIATAGVGFGGKPGAVRIWDVETGREINHLPLTGRASQVFDIAFDANDEKLATAGSDGKVRIWDLETNSQEHVFSGHTDNVFQVTYSPNGKLIASGSRDGSVRIWDVSTKELLTTLGPLVSFRSLKFSPCGRFLAGGGFRDQLFVWDIDDDFKEIARYRSAGSAVHGIAFSPDGQRVAWSDAGSVRIIDTLSGKLHYKIPAHDKFVRGIDFRSDGGMLATCGGERSREVRLWSLPTLDQELEIVGKAATYIKDLVIHPNGRQIALIGHRVPSSANRSHKNVEIWDLENSSQSDTLTGASDWMNKLDYRPNGKQLAAGCQDGTIKIWNVDSADKPRTLAGHSQSVNWVAFHPNEPILASGSNDKSVILWNADDGTEIARLNGEMGEVTCLEFDPTGNCLLVCDGQGEMTVWDIRSPARLEHFQAHEGGIENITISTDGSQLVTAGADELIKIWQFDSRLVNSGRASITLRHSIKHGATKAPGDVRTGFSLSPDGNRLAAIGSGGNLRLWDTSSGQEAFVFNDILHNRSSNAITFSPTGNQLIVERTARIFMFEKNKSDWPPIKHQDKKWHAEKEALCRSSENWFGMRFHLDHLISFQPESSEFHMRRAAALANLDDIDNALADFQLAVQLDQGPMNDALARNYCRLALAQLLTGQIEQYRATCQTAVQQISDSASARQKNSLVWASALAPQSVVDYGRLIDLAKSAVAEKPQADFIRHTLGVILFRAGNYQEAIDTLEKTIDLRGSDGSVFDWIFLAMAHWHLDQDEQARQYAEKTNEWYQQNVDTSPADPTSNVYRHWPDRHELELFRQEFEEMFTGED